MKRPFRVWLPGQKEYVVMASTMREARQRFIEYFQLDPSRYDEVEFAGIVPHREASAIERARKEGTLIE